jgi:toxin-antitoxin system PIN domain toxin
MKLADVNVLINAFRPDATHHALCRNWLADVVASADPFGVSTLVLSAVVRVTTGVRAFKDSSSIEDAFGFCGDLLALPHCRVVEPGNGHWSIFRSLCASTNSRGPATTDAWLAALAIEHGCQWITMDRDFARFPGLRWTTPTLTT